MPPQFDNNIAPTNNLVPPELPHKHNRYIILTVLVILVVVVLLMIGFFWYQSTQKPPLSIETQDQTVETVADQFANWKTYTNTEYGIEFKYPADWEAKNLFSDMAPGVVLISILKKGPTQLDDVDVYDMAGLGLILYSNKDTKIQQEYIQHLKDAPSQAEKFSLNGFQGTSFITSGSEAVDAYKILKDNSLLRIMWERSFELDKPNDFTMQKYLLPIISTFKFTK